MKEAAPDTFQPVTLRSLPLSDLCYAAGYFDADGNCAVTRRKSRGKVVPWQFHAQAAISSGDYGILAWLHERWGGHISKPDYRINPALQVGRGQTLFGSGVCTWSVSHRYVAVFLREILPHLKYKKQLAANALRFMGYAGVQGGNYHGLPSEVYAQQERCFNRHHELSAKLKAQRGRMPKKAA